jgi:hypothetical protein
VTPEDRPTRADKGQDEQERDALAAEGYLFYNAEAREFAEMSAQAFAEVLAAWIWPDEPSESVE